MRTTWLTIIVWSAIAACSGQPEPGHLEPGHPAPGQPEPVQPGPAQNPLAGATQDQRGKRMHGRILERLAAGSYTYLELALDDGSRRWVVVPGSNLPDTGSEIDVVAMGSRTDFHSRRLGRRFDQLVFAALAPAMPGDQPPLTRTTQPFEQP